jgi:hypothetical protein
VGLANLGSELEKCVGSHVRLVGVSISFEKNFYRLPFTPPSLVRHIGPSKAHERKLKHKKGKKENQKKRRKEENRTEKGKKDQPEPLRTNTRKKKTARSPTASGAIGCQTIA